MRSILIFYNHGHEIFEEENVEYFIKRRIEKMGEEPTEAFYIEPFDYKPIVKSYYVELSEQGLRAQEEFERKEFERLKKKFESK